MLRAHRECVEWLRSQGATEIEVIKHHRHHKIAYCYRGERYKRPVPGSPGDVNWFHQFKRDLARLAAKREQVNH